MKGSKSSHEENLFINELFITAKKREVILDHFSLLKYQVELDYFFFLAAFLATFFVAFFAAFLAGFFAITF
jgi:hypothetical protein